MNRCFFIVDVTCPDDIDIPFLMSRDDKGKMHMDLLPKIKQKYSGMILMHALEQLEYKVTRIYSVLKYGQLYHLQKEYMRTIMDKKDKADVENNQVVRNIMKSAANGLTGKHSQSVHENNNVLHYSDEFVLHLSDEHLEKGKVKIETFFNRQEIIGYYVSTPKDLLKFNKPIQIGVQTLDGSKIIMSEIMIKLDLYKTNQCFYTDTDSMVIKKGVHDRYKNLDIWCVDKTSAFGKLKLEYPYVVWTEAVFFSPKTYALRGIDIDKKTPVMLLKAKGAPQPGYLQGPNKLYYTVELDRNRQQKMKKEHDLKSIYYHRILDGTIVEESNYLPFDWVVGMVAEPEYKILVLYNSLKKELNFLKNTKSTAAVVRTLLDGHRTLNQNCWWNLKGDQIRSQMKRIFIDARSYPKGHKMELLNPQ